MTFVSFGYADPAPVRDGVPASRNQEDDGPWRPTALPHHRRSTRRRRRLAVAAALIAPLLAGCGTGFQAQTNQIYQPGPGISVRDDGVYAINTLIVTDGEGNGTLVTRAHQPGASGRTLLESVDVTSTHGDPAQGDDPERHGGACRSQQAGPARRHRRRPGRRASSSPGLVLHAHAHVPQRRADRRTDPDRRRQSSDYAGRARRPDPAAHDSPSQLEPSVESRPGRRVGQAAPAGMSYL